MYATMNAVVSSPSLQSGRVVGAENGGVEPDLRQRRREDLPVDVVEQVDAEQQRQGRPAPGNRF